jgi:hypothetical protein
MPKLPLVKLVETKADKDKAEGLQVEKITIMLEVLSPSTEITVSKAQKGFAATPKRRMANVLDVVLETAKSLTPAPSGKFVEASKALPEAKTKQAAEQIASEKVEADATEALKESIDYVIRHASGKKLSQEEKLEALHYAQKLKYLKGALVFNGSGEEDFLYCLPDNKEISVCREIGRSIGFPKLEDAFQYYQRMSLLTVWRIIA